MTSPPSSSRYLSSDGIGGWGKVLCTRLDVAGGLFRMDVTKRAGANLNKNQTCQTKYCQEGLPLQPLIF